MAIIHFNTKFSFFTANVSLRANISYSSTLLLIISFCINILVFPLYGVHKRCLSGHSDIDLLPLKLNTMDGLTDATTIIW